MPPSPSNTHSRPEQGARASHTQVQVMTDRDPNCTVLSNDGVGAFDLVSRRAMMTAVHSMDQGEKLIPFLLQFYGHPLNTFVGRRGGHSPRNPAR